MKERLQKVIAASGITSRRKAEQFIVDGRVCVNGETVTMLGTQVDPQRDRIEVDGRIIETEPKQTYLFYKPAKVITSVSDPRGRKVVTDYFKRLSVRVYPVGRLDYDTEGLLLMTNDGDLANRMMHPRFEIEKSYLALVQGIPDASSLARLAQGIELDDGLTAPAKVELVQVRQRTSLIRLVIHEGRNRQVKRMCEAVGHPVIKLKRERIGFLLLEGLKPGQYRALTVDELKRLHRLFSR